MPRITIHSPIKDIQKVINKLPVKIFKTQQQAIFKIGNNMRNIAVSFAPYKSGTLRRSITFFPSSQSAITDFIKVGSNLSYARIQDQGGIVIPKKSKYLTIPIGTTRGRARNYPKGFFIKSKKGNIIFAQKKGKTGIKPLFVLKRSIRIKGKPYLSKAFRIMEKGAAARTFQRAFQKVFK